MQAFQMLCEPQFFPLRLHDLPRYLTLLRPQDFYTNLVTDWQCESYPTYKHMAPDPCSSILLPILPIINNE